MDTKGARQLKIKHVIFKQHNKSSSGSYSENHISCVTSCYLIYSATITPAKMSASFLKEKINKILHYFLSLFLQEKEKSE